MNCTYGAWCFGGESLPDSRYTGTLQTCLRLACLHCECLRLADRPRMRIEEETDWCGAGTNVAVDWMSFCGGGGLGPATFLPFPQVAAWAWGQVTSASSVWLPDSEGEGTGSRGWRWGGGSDCFIWNPSGFGSDQKIDTKPSGLCLHPLFPEWQKPRFGGFSFFFFSFFWCSY